MNKKVSAPILVENEVIAIEVPTAIPIAEVEVEAINDVPTIISETKPKISKKKMENLQKYDEFLTNVDILNKKLRKFNLLIKQTFLFESPLINIINHFKREVYDQLRWYIDYKRNNKFSSVMVVNTMEIENYIKNILAQLYNGSRAVYDKIRSDFN